MFSKVDRRKKVLQFEKVNPEIAKKIKPILKYPKMIAAQEKLERLKLELKKIMVDIETCYHGDSAPVTMPDKQADAQAILDGVSIAEGSSETPLEYLSRKKEAIKTAIGVQETEIRVLVLNLCKEACVEIRPVAQTHAEDVLNCFENLRLALLRKVTFYDFISFRGIDELSRPVYWRMTDFEYQLLLGGSFANLDFYVSERRQFWGIGQTKKERQNEKAKK